MSIGLIWLETYEKDSRTCEKTQYILVEEIRSKSAQLFISAICFNFDEQRSSICSVGSNFEKNNKGNRSTTSVGTSMEPWYVD